MKSKVGGDRQSRKRELDRKSQRLARERTKSRMAHLETLVAHFRETDSDARFSSLVDELSDVVSERDSLKGLLKSLDFAIRSQLDDTASCREIPRNISAQPAQDSPDWGQNNQLAICHPTTGTSQISESLQEDPFLFDLPPLPTSFIWGQEDATAPQAVLPGCGCLVGTSSDGGNTTHSFWRQLNELWTGLPGTDLSAEDEESEDAVIRAVLYGWDSIGARSQSLAICRFLRRLDELPWMQPDQINRLAMLSLTRLMLVSQCSARKAELPHWLHARPSQILPHSNAIDFVFWPGVRERLVFFEHNYCNDSFWRDGFSSTKLMWPFDLRDAYVRNSVTDKLHLSPYFRSYITVLSNWAVYPSFLQQYPELRGDIEVYSALLTV